MVEKANWYCKFHAPKFQNWANYRNLATPNGISKFFVKKSKSFVLTGNTTFSFVYKVHVAEFGFALASLTALFETNHVLATNKKN